MVGTVDRQPAAAGRGGRYRGPRRARPQSGVRRGDRVASYHQSPLPTALLLRLAGVPRITWASVDYAGALLSVRLVPGENLPEDLPEPERALRIAAAAGYPLPSGDRGDLAVSAPGITIR